MEHSIIFDMIPIAMAAYALYLLTGVTSSFDVRLAKFAAALLIVCQSTWIHSYVNGYYSIVVAVDFLWTVFNGTAMLLAIRIALRSRQ